MSGLRTGVLLAGGRSVRMGQDKAFLCWRGKPLWRWQGELMVAMGLRRMVLSCRREQGLDGEAGDWAAENGLEFEVVFDPVEGGGGMVEALRRGLETAGERSLVLSVDMPEVTEDLLRLLEEGTGGRLFWGSHGPEPFPGVYTGAMLNVIRTPGAALRGVLEWCVEADLAKRVSVPERSADKLSNWNRPGDVKGEP